MSFNSKAKLSGLAVAAMLATPASAQMKPASHEDIVSAVAACESITTPTWIELDELDELGWHSAKKRGERRRTQVLRGIYEKRGNQAYLVIGGKELKEKSCVVLARLGSTEDYVPAVQQLASARGMPNRQDGPAYFWESPTSFMSAAPSGERDAPNLRITIKALKESAE